MYSPSPHDNAPSDWHQNSVVPEIADDEVSAMTAYGASRPLRRIPAIVSFLNPQPTPSLVSGNRSSCPTRAVRDTRRDRLNWVESECGAAAVGPTYLLPPLSSGGASLVRPWLRFH